MISTYSLRILQRTLFRHSTALILGFVFLGFYSLTLAHNLGAAHDAVTYLGKIEEGAQFDQHHLLYFWLAGKWLALILFIAPDASSMLAIEWLNALFGAASITVVYGLLRYRFQLPKKVSIIASALPGFSYGFWFYSVSVEVYIIPIFFLLVACYLLTSDNMKRKTYVAAGIIYGTAILFNQIHVLFVAPILLVQFYKMRLGFRPSMRDAMSFALPVALTVGIPYLWVAIIVNNRHSILAVLDWVTLYAQDSANWFMPGVDTLARIMIGFGRSIIGGQFLFTFSAFQDAFPSILGGKNVADEMYLTRNMSTVFVAVIVVLSIMTVGLTFAGFWVARRSAAAEIRNPRVATLFLAAWLLTYSLFFAVYQPSNVEFWILQSVIFWIIWSVLVFSGEDGRHQSRIWILTSVTAILLVVNYGGSMRYLSDPDNDYYLAYAQAYTPIAGRGDVIIIPDPWIREGYLKRYTGADVLSLTDLKELAVAEAMEMVIGETERAITEGRSIIVNASINDSCRSLRGLN